MTWYISVSLLKNKLVLKQLGFVFLITYLIISFIFSLIFLPQGAYKELLSLLLIFFLVCLGLFILSLLVMLIVFGNRMNVRFTLDKNGIHYEMVDKRSKFLNSLGIYLGIFTGKSTLTGSSLIAKSKELVFIPYKDIKEIEVDAINKKILLKNNWRILLEVYCNEENFEEVISIMSQYWKEL